MRESPKNMGLVCPAHAPRPDPKLAKIPMRSFVGKYVKLGFQGKYPDGTIATEHMWVLVLRTHGKKLVGKLDNDPALEMEYKCGDEVRFRASEIEVLLEE